MTTPTFPASVVEKVARALFDQAQTMESRESDGFIRRFWNDATTEERDGFSDLATAALNALLDQGEDRELVERASRFDQRQLDAPVLVAEMVARILSLTAEVEALREALRDIASVDRAFVNANGTDVAFMRIIERARAALHQEPDA